MAIAAVRACGREKSEADGEEGRLYSIHFTENHLSS